MPLVLTLFALNCVYVFPFSVSFMIPSFAFLAVSVYPMVASAHILTLCMCVNVYVLV